MADFQSIREKYAIYKNKFLNGTVFYTKNLNLFIVYTALYICTHILSLLEEPIIKLTVINGRGSLRKKG